MKTYKYECIFGGSRTWHHIEARNKKEAIEKAKEKWFGFVTISTFRLIKK